MNIALVIIALFLILALVLGIRARRGRDMDLEQWTVGGRGFGTLFVFLLLAGEIYTTFTFLGGAGWAYGEGGPAFYILSYGALAYVTSYWLLPPIWRYAKENRLHSQSDFFVSKFDSQGLGVFVSLVTVVAMVPYLALQLQGLGIIVSEASYGVVPPLAAAIAGTLVVTIYVIISGIRGSAWTAVIKDVMVLSVAVVLGLYLPFALYGGIGDMFHQIQAQKPGFLALPASGYDVSWFISTVLLTALGFYMWPHTFGSLFSAENPRTIRRNATFLPLYQLIALFIFFVGFAAVLKVHGLEGERVDLALLKISKDELSPFAVGIIGGAGVLTALVPGSMLLMVSATVIAKNVYKPFAPTASEQRIGMIAKILVPIVALGALLFSQQSGQGVVLLLLLGYSLVTQLFPSLLFSLIPGSFVNKWGSAAGIAVGVATVTYVTVKETTIGELLPFIPQALGDTNIGVVALVANFVVLIVVSLATGGLAVRGEEQRA